MSIDWSQISTIVGSLIGGGFITAFFGWLSNRRKNAANGRSVEVRGELQIVDSAITLVATLREDLTRLSSRIEQVENRNRKLEGKIESLENENYLLEQKVSSLTHKIESLENENATLEKKVSSLTDQNDELRERCTALEAENARLRPESS